MHKFRHSAHGTIKYRFNYNPFRYRSGFGRPDFWGLAIVLVTIIEMILANRIGSWIAATNPPESLTLRLTWPFLFLSSGLLTIAAWCLLFPVDAKLNRIGITGLLLSFALMLWSAWLGS